MVQGQPNKLAEMETLVAVAEHGGLSAAARKTGKSPSAVSKLIARLEARLGARLFVRSTRQLQLTDEGAVFLERCKSILDRVDEAERGASRGEEPAGRIRLTVNVPVANHLLMPRLAGFLERFPEVSLEIAVTDRVVDLVDERTDVAIRSGPLPDSSLRVRKLGTTPMKIVAAPAYLDRYGSPASIDDLAAHRRLGFTYSRAVAGWSLRHRGEVVNVPTTGPVHISDGEALRRLAVEGIGMARLAVFQVREDIAAGRLVPVLEEQTAHDTEDINAVFIGDGGPVPARVRALIDYLAEAMPNDEQLR